MAAPLDISTPRRFAVFLAAVWLAALGLPLVEAALGVELDYIVMLHLAAACLVAAVITRLWVSAGWARAATSRLSLSSAGGTWIVRAKLGNSEFSKVGVFHVIDSRIELFLKKATVAYRKTDILQVASAGTGVLQRGLVYLTTTTGERVELRPLQPNGVLFPNDDSESKALEQALAEVLAQQRLTGTP